MVTELNPPNDDPRQHWLYPLTLARIIREEPGLENFKLRWVWSEFLPYWEPTEMDRKH